MEQIVILEKAKFMLKNKDKIIDNIDLIKYDLFMYLINFNTTEDNHFDKINKILKNNKNKVSYIYIKMYIT